MSNDLNQVSQSIGSLQSDVKNLGANIEHLITYIKELNAGTQIVLNKHTEEINSLNDFKNKCYGIAAVCGLAASAAGQYLTSK